jgi:hypothetical protein
MVRDFEQNTLWRTVCQYLSPPTPKKKQWPVQIFLVNKLNKNHKMVRLYRNFTPLAWTKFQTQS